MAQVFLGSSGSGFFDIRFVSAISFFLLFPCFFFYQVLLGAGFIRPLMGGYFGIVSISFLGPLVVAYVLHSLRTGRVVVFDFLVFSFLFWFVLIVVINYFYGVDVEFLKWHFGLAAQFLLIFIVFKYLDYDSAVLSGICCVSLVLMTMAIFIYSVDGFFYLKGMAESAEYVATYQSFALAYFLTFVVAISAVNRFCFRVLLYCLAIPALYLNGARSEFVGLLLFIVLYEFMLSRKRVLYVAILFFLMVAIFFIVIFLDGLIPDNRVLLLFNLPDDKSYLLRKGFADAGYEVIYGNPFWGGYASYAPGEYVHNIFSAWIDLGIVGFLFVLFLLTVPLSTVVYLIFVKRVVGHEYFLVAALLGVTALLILFAKYFAYQVFPAALGAYSVLGRCKAKSNRSREVSETDY
ncbi:hypothetical protein HP532_04525 [Pseudomonas sp. CrR25]|nr:hypothetical protein [Pseudomonas sp. CrR25]